MLWPSVGADSTCWERVTPMLGAHRRLHLVDGPGHGASSPLRADATLQDSVIAAIELLNGLGLESGVDWVGIGWGAAVGRAVAARRPDLVRSLVTLSSATPSRRVARRRLLAELLSPESRDRDPDAVAVVRASIDRIGSPGVARVLRSFPVHDTEVPADAGIPTLAIDGLPGAHLLLPLERPTATAVLIVDFWLTRAAVAFRAEGID